MTILLVSTNRRHAHINEPSGYLYTVDLEKTKVLRRSFANEPAFREYDNNPRGGLRGCKGISVRDDQTALSNYSMVFRYDPEWNLRGVITHPSCAGIHDIAYHEDTIWVTSTRSDLLVQFDFNGNMLRHFYMRAASPALRMLNWKAPIRLSPEEIQTGRIDFRDPRTHEMEAYDRMHVNGISVLPSDDILVSLGFLTGAVHTNLLRLKVLLTRMGIWSHLININRKIRYATGLKKDMHTDLIVQPAKGKSAIVRISQQGQHSLSLEIPQLTVPSHSLLTIGDGTAVYLNSTRGTVIHFQPYSGEILSETKITDDFMRGVTRLTDNTLVMGSKGELLRFNLAEKRLTAKMKLSSDPTESVYDVKVLPPHFALPPVSLEKVFLETVGYEATAILRDNQPIPQLEAV
jgi:hypothetical protein